MARTPSRAAFPAGLVEDLVGQVDVLGEALVVGGGDVDRRRREDVAGRPAGGAVADIDQDLAVDSEREGAPHGEVAQEGVRVVAAIVVGALGAEAGIGDW